MNCMKCGREVPAEQVFCDVCLESVEAYPIRIDSVVQIPRQPETHPGKRVPQHRRASLSTEEQLKYLRRSNRLLVLMLMLVVAISLFLGTVIFRLLPDYEGRALWGQNYSTVEETEAE